MEGAQDVESAKLNKSGSPQGDVVVGFHVVVVIRVSSLQAPNVFGE